MLRTTLKTGVFFLFITLGLFLLVQAVSKSSDGWSEWYALPGMANGGLQFRIGNPVEEEDGYIIAELEFRNLHEDWDIYACFWTDPNREEIKSEHYNKKNAGLLYLPKGASQRMKHKIIFQKDIQDAYQTSKWDRESFLYKTVYHQQSQEEILTRNFLEVKAWIWKDSYGDRGFVSNSNNVVRKERSAFSRNP